MADRSVRLWLETEDGTEKEYEIVGTFSVDGQDYMALLPAGGGAQAEVMLIGFHAGERDEIIFDPIADDAKYLELVGVFEDIFNQDAAEEYRLDEMYGLEREQLAEDQDTEEYCYQDNEGRLFLYDQDGVRIYLNEFGEPYVDEFGNRIFEVTPDMPPGSGPGEASGLSADGPGEASGLSADGPRTALMNQESSSESEETGNE